MIKKNKIKFGMIFLIGILLIVFLSVFISAIYLRSGAQYISPGLAFGTSGYVEEQCGEVGQDFMIQIAPFGCSPAVVRSDFLEEQNAPVFCQLAATKTNPLIEIEAIEDITFSGKYPPEVSGIGFHPAQAALGERGARLNSPILNNIGYVVIVLRQQRNASAMSNCEKDPIGGDVCWVEGNLTAELRYDIDDAFGVGKASFYLPVMNDDEWEKKYEQYGFWNGRAYIRAEGVDNEGATISLYNDVRKISSVNVERGKRSEKIYIPGFDCYVGLKLRLDGLVNPNKRARFSVNGDIVEAGEKERFLDNRCEVLNIDQKGMYKEVFVRCATDEKRGDNFNLIISPKVKLDFDGEPKDYVLGEWLYNNGVKGVYLGFIGTKRNSEQERDLYVRFFESPQQGEKGDILSNKDLADIAEYDEFFTISDSGSTLKKGAEMLGKSYAFLFSEAWNALVDGEWYRVLRIEEGEKEIFGKEISIIGFADSQNQGLQESQENFDNANQDYDKIIDSFSSEQHPDEPETFGEIALYHKMKLMEETEQKQTLSELCEEFKHLYPGSKLGLSFCDKAKLINAESATRDVVINKRIKEISFIGVYEPSFDDYGAVVEINREEANLRLDDVVYLGGAGIKGNWDIDRTPGEIRTILGGVNGYSDCKDYAEYVSAAGRKYRIDPLLLMAIMKQESDCNPNEGSQAGAVGLMQISSWDKDLGGGLTCKDKLGLASKEDLLGGENAEKNIECGAIILKKYFDLHGEKTNRYKCDKYKFTKTKGYIDKVEPSINKEYTSWENALRYYNGDACAGRKDGTEILADHTYVEDVMAKFVSLGGGLQGVEGREYVKLIEIGEDYARFKLNIQESGLREAVWDTSAITIKTGEFRIVGAYRLELTNINLKQFAKVSVEPSIDRARTKVNFPFKIGIEQRSIKLTPEKIKEKIKNTEKHIKDWEDATEKLGKFVKTMNTVCTVTGAGLILKNLLLESGIKKLARKDVMRGSGGWRDICRDLVSKGEYASEDVCLYENSPDINKDVENKTRAMQDQQDKIKEIQKKYNCEKEGIFGSRVVDDDCFLKAYIKETRSELENNLKNFPNSLPEGVSAEEFVQSLNENTTTIEEYKDLVLDSQFNQGVLGDMSKQSIKKVSGDIYKNAELINERETLENKHGVAIDYGSSVVKMTKVVFSEDQTLSQIKEINIVPWGISGDEFARVYRDIATGKKYLVLLDQEYHVKQTYLIDSTGSLNLVNSDDVNPLDLDYKKLDSSSYKNPYKDPEVRYYETGEYKGKPALVPIDTKNGWYVSVESYDDSGVPRIFSICNVMGNGRVDNFAGDDECREFIKGIGQPENLFGLDTREASTLVANAVKAIREAQGAHSAGVREIYIGGKKFKVGEPMAIIPDLQCQDIMSPADCKLLFNVCDPVVCPSSRCNLGGAYNVQNVIQSGISGGLALCAPNWVVLGGDVIIPVCLSGIHAGMDGWLQIQKSYKDCLEDSLKTGAMTGICDEIYSLHQCEFFYRQGLPAVKLLGSKFLETLSGQNVKGGGEYLGMKAALKNADDSVNYFTNYYAKNSFTAFKARSTEQVGTEICKGFISGSFPNFDNFMGTLTEPVSPSQFHGRFEEIPYTTATNPPLSHYKVWYFIYAGKDQGVSYQVYLRGDQEASFYQDTSYRKVVAQGYLAAGERIDKAPDFLEASGYKELCIRVNEIERCGFKQVSTEFAVTYVKDLYVKEQASQENIKGTDECVAGTPSWYSLVSPDITTGNIISGVEEYSDYAIYNRGIIRICATDNPGKGSDGSYLDPNKSRWKLVGVCDEENMKCWLDMNSVERVLDNKKFKDALLKQHSENQLEMLRKSGQYFSEEEFKEVIKKLEMAMGFNAFEEIITGVNENLGKVFLNAEKAYLYLFRGDAYAELAKEAYKGVKKEIKEDVTEEDVTKKEEKTEAEKILESYLSPVFELKDGAWSSNFYYRYNKGEWEWSSIGNKEEYWVPVNVVETPELLSIAKERDLSYVPNEPSDKNKIFIQKFEKASYKKGLQYLVSRVVADNEGGGLSDSLGGKTQLVANDVIMSSDAIFTLNIGSIKFKGKSIRSNKVYFQFENSWKWSFDKDDWNGVLDEGEDLILDEGTFTLNLYSLMIEALRGLDFYDGVQVLFDPSLSRKLVTVHEDASCWEGFTYEQEAEWRTDEIYFSYDEVWKMSYWEKRVWRDVDDAVSFIEENPYNFDKGTLELVKSLVGKDCEKGKQLISDYSKFRGYGRMFWNFETALKTIDFIRKTYGNIDYSDNDRVKNFIDELYEDGLLNDEQFDDINGNWLGGEEDMDHVKKDLLINKAKGSKNSKGQSFSDIEDELEYDVQIKTIDELKEIRYVIEQKSGFIDLYFGYGEEGQLPFKWMWTLDSRFEKWFDVNGIGGMLNDAKESIHLQILLDDISSKTDLIKSLQVADFDKGRQLILDAGGRSL